MTVNPGLPPADSTSTSARSRKVGPFLLGAPLGSGGMGEVWAATHERYGHDVAVKLVRGRLAGGDRALAAFDDEVRAVAALDHPNVVRIYDQGTSEDGAPWLAMERAAGVLSLPGDWEALRTALADLLAALGEAHGLGILHLDVKPSNVLVRADGTHALADFGIAVLRGALGGDPGSATWGSPAYMAPERFDGRPERLTEATDLYAVGCLAFHLAHRAPPFGNPGWERAAHGHRSEPVPPLAPKIEVPPGFTGWVRTLLAKRPGERFASAAEAAHALASLRRGATLLSRARASAMEPTLSATVVGEAVPVAELVAPTVRPASAPIPEQWSLRPRPRRLESVGLGLLGLLAVPFADREAERAVLWRALRARRPALLCLTGPRGVGRTRLGEAFVHAAGALAGAWVLRVHATCASTRCAALGITPETPPDRGAEAAALRLGLAVGDPRVDVVANGDPARALEHLARRHAAARPVVVWIDDVHRDPALVRLARALAAGPEPIVVVTAARDPEPPAGLPIPLAPLDAATARQLLADWVGLAPDLVADLAERSAGDLGLCLAMVREGVATGRLGQGPAGLQAISSAPLPFPREILDAWRQRLPTPVPAPWVRAAVLGATVDRRHLALALADDAAGVEAQLLERGLGVPTADGWRWASPAIRELILSGAGDLRDHHRACAAARTDDPWAHGTHLVAAGALDEALPALFSVASEVIASGRMAEASRRLDEVEHAMRAAEVPESNPAWGRLARSRAQLGPTHQGYARCRAHNERCLALARRYDADPAWRLLRIQALGGLAWLANVQLRPDLALPYLREEGALLVESGKPSPYHYDRMGWYALTIDNAALAVRSFGQAVKLAIEMNNRHIRYVGDAALGVAMARAGDPGAIAHLTRAGRVMLDAGFLSARGDLAIALGDAERRRGNFHAAEAHYEEALRAAAEGEARADLGFRVGYALLHRDAGRLDRARDELAACARMLGEEGPTWESLVAVHAAAVARAQAEPVPDVGAARETLLAIGYRDPDLARSLDILSGAEGRSAGTASGPSTRRGTRASRRRRRPTGE